MKYFDLLLASASPQRAHLIKRIPWLRVKIVPSLAEESLNGYSDAVSAAVALAQIKAEEVHARTGAVTLGADTVVSQGGRLLGKPQNAQQAYEMFQTLCNRTHEVVTGLCIISKGRKLKKSVKTRVTFGALDDKIVYNYIKSGAPFDKAGGYGIQDKELAGLIKEVDGSLDNVIGLPVKETEELLKEFIEWQ